VIFVHDLLANATIRCWIFFFILHKYPEKLIKSLSECQQGLLAKTRFSPKYHKSARSPPSQNTPFDAEFNSASYTSIQKIYSSPWANVSKDYWLSLDFIQYFHPSTTKGLDDPPRKIHHSTQNLILHLTQVSRKFTQVVERMSARITS